MTDSIYAFVIAALEDAKGHLPQVAEESGISKRTIEKIANRVTKDPGVHVIEKLAKYFRGKKVVTKRTRF